MPPYISTRLALLMTKLSTSAAELPPSAVPFISVPPFTLKGAFYASVVGAFPAVLKVQHTTVIYTYIRLSAE